MQPVEEWTVERRKLEWLIIEASRTETSEARAAAARALDAFVSRFPEHADKVVTFRLMIDRPPILTAFAGV